MFTTVSLTPGGGLLNKFGKYMVFGGIAGTIAVCFPFISHYNTTIVPEFELLLSGNIDIVNIYFWLSVIAPILTIVTGIIGILNTNIKYRAPRCIIMGSITLAFQIAYFILRLQYQSNHWLSIAGIVFFTLLSPALFIIGGIINKKSW